MAGMASGDIGAPRVAIGFDGGVDGELAEGSGGEAEDGYGVTGAMAVAPLGGLPVGVAAGGVANDGAAPPMPKPGTLAGRAGLPPNAKGPPGDGDALPLGNSTFGTAGHPSATPGGAPGSALFRASDTYTPYPTAANTAMISKFFSEFMFVLLDESRQSKRADHTRKRKTMLWQ
jgi:hypothetical protein